MVVCEASLFLDLYSKHFMLSVLWGDGGVCTELDVLPEDEKLKLVKRWLCLYFIIVILTVETETLGKTENITTMQNLSNVSVFAYVNVWYLPLEILWIHIQWSFYTVCGLFVWPGSTTYGIGSTRQGYQLHLLKVRLEIGRSGSSNMGWICTTTYSLKLNVRNFLIKKLLVYLLSCLM